jgi:hypothetical protein
MHVEGYLKEIGTLHSSLSFGIYAPFHHLKKDEQSLIALSYKGELAHHRVFGASPYSPLSSLNPDVSNFSLLTVLQKAQTKMGPKIEFMVCDNKI